MKASDEKKEIKTSADCVEIDDETMEAVSGGIRMRTDDDPHLYCPKCHHSRERCCCDMTTEIV